MEPWEGVLKIPKGRRGNYVIQHFKHPAGTVLATGNMRTRLIGGQPFERLRFNHETTWHKLRYEGGVWMTDLPIEQAQHDRELLPFEGSVLVAGLGLGYCLEVLARNELVDDILVVEKSQEVVDLVWPHVSDAVREKATCEVADIFEFFVRLTEDSDVCAVWDYGFYDIWQADSLGTFFDTVLPLLELSALRVDEVVCWNEDVMRGQLASNLIGRMLQTVLPSEAKLTLEDLAGTCPVKMPEGRLFQEWDWARPFFKTLVEKGVREPGEEFNRLAGMYALSLGRMEWKHVLELDHE